MRNGGNWYCALVCLSSLALGGCSSSYRPMNSPRIAVGMQSGALVYYKDGKQYAAGFFGGGVVDAVQGNPQAVAAAETGHGLMIGGFVVSMASIPTFVAGAVLVGDGRDSSPKSDAGLGLMLGAVGMSIAGLVLSLNAVPHYYDAVAIYNDSVPPYGPYPGPYQVPQRPWPVQPQPLSPQPMPPQPMPPQPMQR